MTEIELRPYQIESENRLRSTFKGGASKVVYTLPTGGGKTVVASSMIKGAAARGRFVLFLAHRIELVEQASAALDSFGIKHGVIAVGRSMTRHRVQVGMIRTVLSRMSKMYWLKPDLIIIDEAHHSTAATYTKVVAAWPRAWIVGLTATPERTDGTGLKEVFDALVTGPSVRELIDGGYLAPYQMFSPETSIDLQGIKRTGGDYQKGELAKRVDQQSITGDAVDHYRRLAGGQTFVAFCVSVEHAEHVAEQFTAAGYPCASIDGSMDRGTRSGILSRLRAGQLLGVTSCDLISEGFDLPGIWCAILLRPTESLIVYLQQIGRALRWEPGKTATILDHVGNIRHGLPCADRNWTLEGKKRKRGDKTDDGPGIRRCGKCYGVYPATTMKCPYCESLGLAGGGSTRQIVVKDGQLVEISEAVERKQRRFDQYRASPQRTLLAMVQQCVREKGRDEAAQMLLEMQKAKGYKLGWAIGRMMDTIGFPFPVAAQKCGVSIYAAEKMCRKRNAA